MVEKILQAATVFKDFSFKRTWQSLSLENRKKVFIALAALVGFTIGSYFTSHFRYSVSPSLRYSFFYVNSIKQSNIIERGDYVVVSVNVPVSVGLLFTSHKAIKEVGCISGDALNVVGKDYYCGGNSNGFTPETAAYLGRAKDYALNGEKMESFVYNGVIPEGKMFVIGHHKNSYDSRYFGFVKKDDVEAKAYPIF